MRFFSILIFFLFQGDAEDACLLEAPEMVLTQKGHGQSSTRRVAFTTQTLPAQHDNEPRSHPPPKDKDFSISFKGNRRYYECRHCDYKTQRKYNLSRHLDNHAQIKKFSCLTCGKKFNENYRLDEHVRCVHNKEMSCEMCGKAFRSKTGLQYHLDSHLEKFSCACTICGKQFVRQYSLHIHMKRRHAEGQEFLCSCCKEVFQSKALWTAHKAKCGLATPVLCPECGKLFKTKRLLLDHQRGIHGPHQYSCRCGKTFQWRSSLHYHMKRKCVAPFQTDLS